MADWSGKGPLKPPRPIRRGIADWPRVALLVRGAVERYALGGLILASIALIVLGKADVKAVGWLTGKMGDLVAPVLSALKEPVATVREAADGLATTLALREENARLREESRRLLVWQAEAARLAVENEALRQALRMPRVEAAPLWTTARVVADPGGPFVRTLLLDAGADRGIEKGMAVVDSTGLVGRVTSVGRASARVLLLTDLNSKIPVITERTRDQAILEGTNDRRPELRFLPKAPSFAVGDRVLTSGQGGVLPAGLLIGEIEEIRDQRTIVRAYVDWDRLDVVGVVLKAPVRSPEADPTAAPPAPAPPPAPGKPGR